MINLNTYGQKRKRVVATITTKVEFVVGGESDTDRVEAVTELFEDHYDEIAEDAFLRQGIVSMTLDDVKVDNETGELNFGDEQTSPYDLNIEK